MSMRPGKWLLAATCSSASLGAASAQIGVLPQEDTTLHEASDDKFKVGDVWEYATREGEEKSALTVLKVESSLSWE